MPNRGALTLDPRTDAEWEQLGALGHRMLDDMLEHLRTVRDRPAGQPVPEEAKARLRTGVPGQGIGAAEVYERFMRDVLVEQNVAQARYLAEQVQVHPALELLAPVPLDIVCLRYRGTLPAEELDAANAEILMRLQERGIAVPSAGRTRGAFAIRCAITNHRSRREDFDLFVRAVLEIGSELEHRVAE